MVVGGGFSMRMDGMSCLCVPCISVWLGVCSSGAVFDRALGMFLSMGPSVVAICFLFLCVFLSVVAVVAVGGAVGGRVCMPCFWGSMVGVPLFWPGVQES